MNVVVHPTPVGPLHLASDGSALIACEFDGYERGLAHLTASMTINRPDMPDMVLYLARATVFDGEVAVQGLGTEAKHYGAHLVDIKNEKRLQLTYEGKTSFDIAKDIYSPRQSVLPGDIFA